MGRFSDIFGKGKTLIGMIHLPPLPDYPGSPGIEKIIERALADLATLKRAGFDGVLVENEYDRPHRVEAAPATVAAMTEVCRAVVRERGDLVVGCEILLNDPRASIAVANEIGAGFVRTDYFVDAMTRPEYGEFAIDPDGLMQYRQAIGAQDVLLLADIQVKYATMIESRPLRESASIACDKGADAIVVTGQESGDAPDESRLRQAMDGVGDSGVPVLVGSGLDSANAISLLSVCDGAIVGTSLMARQGVDPEAAESLMSLLAALRP